MKIRLLGVSCWLFMFVVFCAADVIVHWRFEETNGWQATDSVGGYTLTTGNSTEYGGWSTNTPTNVIPATGTSNQGSLYVGGGSGLYVAQSGSIIQMDTTFTVECYLNMGNMAYISSILYLGSDWGGSKLSLFTWWEDGKIYFSFSLNGTRRDVAYPDFQLDQWYHYAFVKDEGSASVYLDGILLAEFGNLSGLDGIYTFASIDPGDMRVGNSWRGYLDEMRISDVALAPEGFLNHYAVVPEPGTMALLALGSGVLALRRRKI